MPASSAFIQKINQYLPLPFSKADKKTYRPLLSNNEIIDLLQRAQNKKKSTQYKREIAHKQIGENQSIYRGHGMDYEESRRYQPGDDPRYMNWQLTARTGQHYMKIFREERQPSVFILVDRRHTMRFGTKLQLKITQAVKTAALAAFNAQQNNQSVGGVIVDNELEWFKENQSKQAIFDFIHKAARPAIPYFYNQNAKDRTFENILQMLNVVLTKGSTILLISDFFDLKKNSQSSLLKLASSHHVNAFHIIDPAEIKLPKAGIISLQSLASNKRVLVDSNSLKNQKAYESASTDYFHIIKNLFNNSAINYQQVSTTVNNIEEIFNF